MNAVVQDAFLGRGTSSPFLALLNHMGLRMDENAPKSVSDDVMEIIGSNKNIDQLANELSSLRAELTVKHRRPGRATAGEKEKYNKVQLQLRTARQKHRRKVLKLVRKGHFDRKDNEELQNQRLSVPYFAITPS